MTKLLEADRHGIIMTCIDHFGKMVTLVPLYDFDTYTVAIHFLVEVMGHCYLILAIVSDRKPNF